MAAPTDQKETTAPLATSTFTPALPFLLFLMIIDGLVFVLSSSEQPLIFNFTLICCREDRVGLHPKQYQQPSCKVDAHE